MSVSQVEAYELFKAIYLERGYQQQEIPQLILEKNLFGLDIDERAAQLTSFALMMKGRGDDRRLFERGIQLNVMALANSDGLDVEGLANAVNLADHGLKLADLVELKQLFEHATTFGSLIQVPDGLALKLPALRRLSEWKGQDMLVAAALKTLEPLVRQAEMLAARYDAVVANPPYMGSRYYCPMLKNYIISNFEPGKGDLYGAFMLRNIHTAKKGGRVGMITIPNWMFLPTFEELRIEVLGSAPISSLVHNGRGVWGSDFGSCAFSLRSGVSETLSGRFLKLFMKQGSVASNDVLEHRFHVTEPIDTRNSDLRKLPRSPIAYWLTKRIRETFSEGVLLGSIVDARQGLATADNNKFVRLWHEVDIRKTGFGFPDRKSASASLKKWFPYNKGGDFRKWYGNQEFLVNWEEDGRDLIAFKPRSVIRNPEYYFKTSLSWSDVTSGPASFRIYDEGFIHDVTGMSAFSFNRVSRDRLAAYCNTPIAISIARAINPTLHFQIGDFSNVPYFMTQKEDVDGNVDKQARMLITAARRDWDAYERSWDFQSLPLLSASSDPSPTLESSYTAWIANNKQTIAEMKRLEEENNHLFIDAYGLQDELTPEVPIEQITLTVNPAYRYGGNLTEDELWNRFRQDTIKELLSYATGCMMGRYSLDQPGLILANAGDTLENYVAKVGKSSDALTFQPDSDGIIPVLDGEWFEDDIVARSREFLRVCFPASSLNTDLAFIETSLGKDLRKYFCTDFYKDHLQTYKKRPIYWLVQSPKKGFACLIYLHRYTKDTLNLVLNNYFRPYLQKLEARLAQLGLDQLNDALPTRDRTAARKEAEKITKVLKECEAWEQDALLPLAQQRIELDLDDGVKVNYLKLQDVLAPIPGLAAKEEG